MEKLQQTRKKKNRASEAILSAPEAAAPCQSGR